MVETEKSSALLCRLARGAVTAAVLVAPWLFGAADAWVFLGLILLVGLGFVLWLFSLICSAAPRLRAPLGTGLLAGIGLLVLFQFVPLPPAAVAVLNPRIDAMRRAADLALQAGVEEEEQAPAALSPTLSAAPGASRRSLLLWLAYVGVFLVLANGIREWSQLRACATVLVVSGFLLALLSLLHKFSGEHRILWIRQPREYSDVFGPFTNRNHCAAHLNMLFGVGLGLFLASSHFAHALGWPDWRDRLGWLSSRRAGQLALSSLSLMVIGGAVCVSLSRGGMLSLFLSVAGLGWVFARRHAFSQRAVLAMAAIVCLLAGGVLWLGWGPVAERLGTVPRLLAAPGRTLLRPRVTVDTLAVFGAAPLTGCGFGAYRHVFPMFQTPALSMRWLHAHNDWAQMLAEGGLAAGLLFLAAVAALLRLGWRRLSRLDARSELFLMGISVGLVSIAIHSVADYSLHKPANALLLAAMAGMAVAVLYLPGGSRSGRSSRRHEAGRGKGAPADSWRRSARWMKGGCVVALALWLVAGASVLRELRGELAYARFRHLVGAGRKARTASVLAETAALAADEAELVLGYTPDRAEALKETGGAMFRWALRRDMPVALRVRMSRQSLAAAEAAVRAAPSDYLCWLWLARARAVLGRWEAADAAFRRARALTRTGRVTLFG